jgi:hypothetical protein
MPTEVKASYIKERVCCEAWAVNAWQYFGGFGQDRKKCTCETARVAASEATLKIVEINRSHIYT